MNVFKKQKPFSFLPFFTSKYFYGFQTLENIKQASVGDFLYHIL